MTAYVPQQLGVNVPGLTGLVAVAAGTMLTAQVSVFSSVDIGGYARLPATSASSVELVVINRSVSALPVIAAGQINDLGVGAPYNVPAGAAVLFYCLDPPMEPGQQWYVGAAGNVLGPSSAVTGNLVSFSGASGKTLQDSGYSPLVFTPPIATIAALRAMTTLLLPQAQCYVAGYTSVMDGGQGLFLLKASDTTSADNGGTIIVDGAGRRWYRAIDSNIYSVKWFGAKGDGVTDDTAALQTTLNALAVAGGGFAVLPAGNYLTSATLTISASHISIEGISQELSTISFNQTTGAIIAVHGVSTSSQIAYNEFRNFSVNRTVAPADSTARGIDLKYTVWSKVDDVTSSNNRAEFVCRGTNGLNYRRCTGTRSITGGTSWAGFWLDCTENNASVHADDCNAVITGDFAAAATGSAGMITNGGNIQDCNFTRLETAGVHIGCEIDATGASLPVDIHFDDCINDSYYTAGFFITSAGAVAAITINDGWNSPLSTGSATYGIRAVQSRGVTVTGGCQILGGGNFAHNTGVSLEGCFQCKVVDANIQNNATNVAIVNSGSVISELNTVNNNSFFNLAAQPATVGVQLVSASRNSVIGNTFDGSGAGAIVTAISADANSNFNNLTPNNFNPGVTTTQIANSGTANSVALGVVT